MNKHVGRITAGVVLGLCILLILLIGGGYAFLQTDSGRAFLVEQIETAVGTEDGLALDIAKLEGNVFGDFVIDQVTVTDSKGVWLTLQDAHISWSPFALLSGTARINEISAKKVSLYRQPDLPASPESESSDTGFSLPLRVSLAKFYIDQFDLEEAVLGRQGSLRVSMNLNSKTDTTLLSELKITPLDGQGGFVAGEIIYSLATTRLGISAELDGPQGGLMSRVLGLPGYPAVGAMVVGDGPINDWQGQVTATVEDLFAGDLLILSKGNAKIEVEVSGGARVSSQLASDIPLVDDRRIAIEANLLFDPEENDLTVNSAVIENNAVRLGMNGSIDLETLQMAATLDAKGKQTEAVNDLIAPAAIKDLSATVKLNGDMKSAQVEAGVQMIEGQIEAGADAAPIKIKTITAQLSSTISPSDFKAIPFDGRVTLSGLEGLPAAASEVVGPTITVNTAGQYAMETGAVELQNLSLISDYLQMQAAGQIYPGAGPTQATFTAVLSDLQKLEPSVKGTVNVEARLSSANVTQALKGRLDVNLAKFDLGDAALQKLLGSEVAAGVDFSMSEDRLTVEGQMPLAAAHVSANAEIPMTFETITATIKGDLPKLDALSELAGRPLNGSSFLTADITGALADPDVKGLIDLRSLKVNELEIGDAKTSFTAKTVASSLNGKIDGAFLAPLLDLQFGATYDLADGSNLKVADLKITQQGNLVDGEMVIPLDGKPISGKLDAAISNFMSVALLSDAELTGYISATAKLENDQGEQAVKIDLAGQDLSMGEDLPGIETVDLKLNAERALTHPEFDVKLVAGGISNSNMRLKDAQMNARGTLEQVLYDFSAESGMDLPFKISGDGKVALADSETALSLSSLQGFVARKKIELLRPLNLVQRGDEIRVDPFAIAFGGGQINGDASILNTQANVNLAIKSFPLDLLNLISPETPVSGAMNAKATLVVTPDSSEGSLSAELVNVMLTGPNFQNIPALSSQLSATLSGGKLNFDGSVSGLTETSISASGNIPVEVALAPISVTVSEQAPLDVSLDVKSNLDKLWPLLGLDQHLVNGNLFAKGDVSGTVAAPKITGELQLSEGRYEEIELGTIIEQLQLKASVQEGETIAISASGVDGDVGTISLSGRINLADMGNPDMDISAKLREMAVLRQDALSVITDADMAVTGTLDALSINGKVSTQTVEVDIGGAIAPSVVEIPVTEVNFPDGRGSDVNGDGPASSQNISLSIDIALPRRVFIRGRGLDSEWEGNLRVTGTTAAPLITGELSPVRGQFTFSGKTFELQKGTIQLRGKTDIDPELSLAAKHVGKNVTAIVSIEGTASNPEITFSSPDNLPEDEVLSRVLFGKSAAKLSALEALQLAQAVAEVSGSLGGGGGIMGFARQSLGVDVLSAGVNEDTGDAEVSVGKYINDSIYVGVAQGTTAGSTAARVEIELTPNLTIESETDQTTNSSVGVFWKWDY